MQVFKERGKAEYPGQNPSEQRREQQTQPTYDGESGYRRHHYATTALWLCLNVTARNPGNNNNSNNNSDDDDDNNLLGNACYLVINTFFS